MCTHAHTYKYIYIIKVHRIVLSPVLTLTVWRPPVIPMRPSMEPMLPEGSEPHRQRGRPRERRLGRRSVGAFENRGDTCPPPKWGEFRGIFLSWRYSYYSWIMHYNLFGGLEPWNFMTFHMLGISSSQLTNSIIFQRGWNHQPVTHDNAWSCYNQLFKIVWVCLKMWCIPHKMAKSNIIKSNDQISGCPSLRQSHVFLFPSRPQPRDSGLKIWGAKPWCSPWCCRLLRLTSCGSYVGQNSKLGRKDRLRSVHGCRMHSGSTRCYRCYPLVMTNIAMV
jgi:hypothetical protein